MEDLLNIKPMGKKNLIETKKVEHRLGYICL